MRAIAPTARPIAARSPLARAIGAVARAFTPAVLFRNGQQGVWYEPKPVIDGQQILYQDSAGTTPVTSDGDPVGFMRDLSGNGNHATQSTSAARPLYRTDGTLHWLEFDGVDDGLDAGTFPSVLNQPNTVLAAASIVNFPASGGGYAYDSSAGTDRHSIRFTAAGEILQFAGTNLSGGSAVGTGTGFIASSEFNGVSSILRVDATQIIEGDSGSHELDGFKIGSRWSDSDHLNAKIYGIVCIGEGLTATRLQDSENYIANLAGITI